MRRTEEGGLQLGRRNSEGAKLRLSFSTHVVAIPEHRAKVLRATLSPNRIFRAGPVTVATGILTFPLL